jgi:hypothetical protein
LQTVHYKFSPQRNITNLFRLRYYMIEAVIVI